MRVANLSTLLSGSEDQVFAGLRAAFRAAQRHGSTVMAATFAAGMPTDELVGEIQEQVDGDRGWGRTARERRPGPPARGRPGWGRRARGGARGAESLPLVQGLDHPRTGGAPRSAVAVGVVFWAWGLLWSTAFQAVPFPFPYALVGVWMIGGLLVPYIVRRPGAALVGELVAAVVSMALGNQWGVLTLASGVVQGVGAELVFAGFRWKRFTGVALYGAAALAGVFSILLDIFLYSYYATYTWGSILVAAILCVVSSIILGGGLSQLLGEALARTGVLSGLEISRGKVKRI